MPQRRRMRKKKQSEVTLNSSIFANEVPAATSSPNKKNDSLTLPDDLFKTTLLESIDNNGKEYFAKLESSSAALMTLMKRKIRKLMLELDPNHMNQIVEYWTLEGYSKAEEQRKQHVYFQAARDKEQRIPLASLHSNKSSGVSEEQQKYDKKHRSSSVPPLSKKEDPDDENELFKRPRGRPAGASRKRTPSVDRLKTPMNTFRRNIATVTPGPDINKPLTVMRRPKPGELAISLSGSPLLVSTDSTSAEMPYVNVPMDSEKVLSIFPRSGFSREDVPVVDHETKQQLRLLREYLNEMCD